MLMKVLLKKMLIEDPVTVFEDEPISEVLQNKMGEFNHLPVVTRSGQYVGIVSKVSIYPFILSNQGSKLVSEIVVPFQAICVVNRGVSLLEDLLGVLKDSKFLFIPVVTEDGAFEGIIPNKVVLNLFGKTLGMEEQGEVIEVTVPDTSGNLSKISSVFRNAKVNIIALNVLNLDVFNLRQVYIKFKGDKQIKEQMLEVLESLGFKSFS